MPNIVYLYIYIVYIYIYIYKTKSLCCTAKFKHSIVNLLYSNKKLIKKKKEKRAGWKTIPVMSFLYPCIRD